MLKKVAGRKGQKTGGNFAIIAARYNTKYTDALVKNARAELKAGGAGEVEVIRVPGSFEVPAVAARIAKINPPRVDAIICFGVILRGHTTHAQNIADAVSNALALLQIETGLPIIHAVLLFENEDQARIRCLEKTHNRGLEAARTALEMARVMRTLK